MYMGTRAPDLGNQRDQGSLPRKSGPGWDRENEVEGREEEMKGKKVDRFRKRESVSGNS
jgi:hypothetical protein